MDIYSNLLQKFINLFKNYIHNNIIQLDHAGLFSFIFIETRSLRLLIQACIRVQVFYQLFIAYSIIFTYDFSYIPLICFSYIPLICFSYILLICFSYIPLICFSYILLICFYYIEVICFYYIEVICFYETYFVVLTTF